MDIVIAIIAAFFASILAAIIIVVCTTVRSLRERILLLERVIKDKDNEYDMLKKDLHFYIKEVLELEGKRSKYYDELKEVYCSSGYWGNVKAWMNDKVYDLIMDPKTLHTSFKEKTERVFQEHMNNINKK